MATRVQVVFDCAQPEALAVFWAEALGYIVQEQGAEWEGRGAAIIDPDGVGPRVWFQRVPEGKVVKNRVHLDVNVGQDEIEVAAFRLEALGASRLTGVLEEDGERLIVMADPEGNEFCLQ